MIPVVGLGRSPRGASFASANAPARDAISSATMTSGRSRSAAREAELAVGGGAEPELRPERALDAAHGERHRLARPGVGGDEQHVHAGMLPCDRGCFAARGPVG